MLAATTLAQAASVRPWDYPLYLDFGTPAAKRVKVEIENKTDADFKAEPVRISAKKLGLVGEKTNAIRVVQKNGRELLFAVSSNAEKFSEKTSLVLPVDCPAKGSAELWVYYSNHDALEVPDFFIEPRMDENFDADDGAENRWTYLNKPNKTAVGISTKYSRSGKNSLRAASCKKSPYAHKMPLRFDTKRAIEKRGFPREGSFAANDTLKISAYVKTDALKAAKNGGAGIGVVYTFANGKYKIEESELLSDASDWTKISFTSKIPADATSASLAAVAKIGADEAFFDDIKVSKIVPKNNYAVKVSERETLELGKDDSAEKWETDDKNFNLRIKTSFFNFGEKPTGEAVGIIPISIAARGNFRPSDYKVYKNGTEVPHALLNGEMLVLLDGIAPKTEAVYNVYIAENRKNIEPKIAVSKQASYILSDLVSEIDNGCDAAGLAKLTASSANKIENANFEKGFDGWNFRSHKGRENTGEISLVDGGVFGGKALSIKFNKDIAIEQSREFKFPGGASSGKHKYARQKFPNHWFGIRRKIETEAGRKYINIAWVKGLEESVYQSIPRMAVFSGGKNSYARAAIKPTSEWKVKSCTYTAKDGDEIWIDAFGVNKADIIIDGLFAAECIDATKFEYQARADFEKPRTIAWSVSPIVKVFDFFAPPAESGEAAISLAKNEQENLQFALRSNEPLRRLEISATTPKLVGGSATLEAPTVSVARNVVCDAPSRYQIFNGVKFNERCVPRNSMIQLYPDPLVRQNFVELSPNKTESVWLKFGADESAAAGEYEGKVEFKDGGKTVLAVPYRVRVRNFAIPKSPSLGAIFDSRGSGFNGGWRLPKKAAGITSKFYDISQLQEFMAQYRTSINKPPRIKFYTKDGKLSADFSDFDKFCENAFGKLGTRLMYLPNPMGGFGFANPINRIKRDDPDAKPIAPYDGEYPYAEADKKILRPEFVAELQAQAKLVYKHLDEKGWRDRFLWYVCDEPHCDADGIADMTKAYCAAVKAADPKARLYSSTWAYIPMLEGGINVWGIDMSSDRTPADIEKIEKRGEEKAFTTDGNYCINTPYCAQERLIPLYCFAGGFIAHEYWGVDWYTRDPFKWGFHYDRISSPSPTVRNRTRYPNGDGYFVYSGEIVGRSEIFPSVRFESVRDGQEDYEYFKILEKLAAKTGDASAQKTLEKVKSLAVYPNARGTRSTELLPDPAKLENLREEVAGQIERLNAESPQK